MYFVMNEGKRSSFDHQKQFLSHVLKPSRVVGFA